MCSTSRCLVISLVIGMSLVLTGCVSQPTKPNVLMVPEMGDNQIARLLDYVNNVLSLSPTAQTAAQANLSQQYKLTQFPEDRMRLALLDILLPKPSRNLDEAVSLLSGYNWEAVGPGFNGLANLLLHIANSQQADTTINTSLAQQLATERSQKDHLQQQLDALKSIEKTMDKRDKSIVAPPATKLPPAATSHSKPSVTPPGEPL
jgi:hypothetical protein